MTDEMLHRFSEENGIPFENALAAFVKERILFALYEKGFGKCLWLKNKAGISLRGYQGRTDRSLRFVYKEDERILKNDGFVPGCSYDDEFLQNLFELELKAIPELDIKQPEYRDDSIAFDVYYKEMYVPILLQVIPLREENMTPQAQELTLPILNRCFEVCTYPLEQEAAAHVAKICKELELINEMEHYLFLYKLFSENAIEGVRLQNAMGQELERNHLSFARDDFNHVLGFRDYGYMKKKWKVLLRRQKLTDPAWEEVIDLLDKVLSPIWQTAKEDMIFFGDWMPEIGRYLD